MKIFTQEEVRHFFARRRTIRPPDYAAIEACKITEQRRIELSTFMCGYLTALPTGLDREGWLSVKP